MKNKTKNPITLVLFIIAVCIGNTGMAQNKSMCPDGNHPHAIDLGLPSGTKWACCNVNAHAPWECGEYYAWGECGKKDIYDIETYSYNDKSIGEDISHGEHDVACQNWGDAWSMPTNVQVEELFAHCTMKWHKYQRQNGMSFTGPNGNSIFIPANGFKSGKRGLSEYDKLGRYWASNLKSPGRAYRLSFDKDTKSIKQNKNDYATGNSYGQVEWGLGIRSVNDNKYIDVQKAVAAVQETTPAKSWDGQYLKDVRLIIKENVVEFTIQNVRGQVPAEGTISGDDIVKTGTWYIANFMTGYDYAVQGDDGEGDSEMYRRIGQLLELAAKNAIGVRLNLESRKGGTLSLGISPKDVKRAVKMRKKDYYKEFK